MTAFLPARPVALLAAPWLSACLAVASVCLVAAGTLILQPSAITSADDAFGAELVLAFEPMLTQAESAASEAAAPEPPATPQVEASLSRPTEARDLPTEQASPEEATDPDLRMAQERTQEESETTPKEAQPTEAAEAQETTVETPAAAPAEASQAQQAEQRQERTAAPMHGNTADAKRRIEAWQRAIFAHIARFKTYPEEARKRHVGGEVVVVFQLDRTGRVGSARVGTASGSAVLDQAAVAVLARASPLPRPPSEVQGEVLELHLPLRYQLR